jgi:hypothetical protein
VLRTQLSAENFLDLQREARSFEALGGYIGTGFTLSGRGEPEFVTGQMISAQLLDALDVQPLFGRPFRPEENEGGRDQVMLLGYALWQRRYGADPAIVGQTLTANGKPYTVVGTGACAGMLLAACGLDAIIALSPGDIPRLDQTRLDVTTLAVTLGITLAMGIVFALVPALQATKHAPAEHLKAAARSTTPGRANQYARAALVAAEVALSLMLMVGAGLAARTLLQL